MLLHFYVLFLGWGCNFWGCFCNCIELFPLSAIPLAEDVATSIKSVTITHEAKEELIRKLSLEGHVHLNNLNHVTTSDVADAWLSANVTSDWTILVEALFTVPGLGYTVSGVLPLSK